MMNYYESKYGLYDCWKCLCEVCTRIGCPKNMLYRSQLEHCLKMRRRECCPVVKCDFFTHKEKHIVLRVKRRARKNNRVLDRLDWIIQRLGGGFKDTGK